MYLTEKEVERFYGIWFPLLHFVNQHQNVVPSFPKKWGDADVPPEVAAVVRDALWEEDTLREAFIAENPAKLSQDDLALVESWKHRVADEFFVFRHLKKYTIFIDGSSPAKGYGVLGIIDPLEAVIGPYLPVYVQAVLLPFEDRVIYDSILSPYRIYFGSGYKHSLKEAYRDIQERDGIITRLPASDAGSDQERVEASDKKVLADFASEYLHQKSPATRLLDLAQSDIEAYQKLRKGHIKLVSFKRFAWFLRDTGRMDWGEVESLLDYLKGK